jgi:hypothetical protein
MTEEKPVTATDEREQTSGRPKLWFMLLAPPVAWSLCFLLLFIIAQWGCSAGFADTEVAGISIINISGITVALLAGAVIFYAGRLGYLSWKQAGGKEVKARGWLEGRRRFIGLFGLFGSVLFLTGIVLQTIAVLVLPPCLF